ncbi:MAG: DNA polymerase III subunit delta' [Rhodospirillales bacterium]|nr:DNA polymerase III subunit delta' [Rhodospirillales bacterium]
MIPPRANPDLFGQEQAEATLAAAMASGRLHHAWLITGAEGIGKATLAYRFARRLLAGPASGESLALDPSHPVFHRVAAGSHADLLTVERAADEKTRRRRAEIVVDDTRAVAAFLHLTAAEGGWRVVIVDGADTMNRNAANALLKVLEEPPPRSILLLLASSPGRLLPTIRSRCRRLALEPLADALVERLLHRAMPDLEDTAGLVALAQGSIGRALTLAQGSGLACARLADEALEGAAALRAFALADEVLRLEDGYGLFMTLLRQRLAEQIASRGRQGEAVARRLPLAAWVELWQGLGALQAATEGVNLEPRQALLEAMARLRALA